jgi:hypothetical protein
MSDSPNCQQYNALLGQMTGKNAYYSTNWTGPGVTSYDGAGALCALDVLSASVGLVQNSTPIPTR